MRLLALDSADEEPSSLQVSAYERLVRSRMFALSAMADGFWSVVAEHKYGILLPNPLWMFHVQCCKEEK